MNSFREINTGLDDHGQRFKTNSSKLGILPSLHERLLELNVRNTSLTAPYVMQYTFYKTNMIKMYAVQGDKVPNMVYNPKNVIFNVF